MAYHLQEKLDLAKTTWEGEFRTDRETWRQLRQRKLQVSLPPEIVVGDDYYQYKTPDLEKASADWQDIGSTNPTIFDLITIDQSIEAKEAGRDTLMWLARGWENENEARWWDRSTISGQVDDGIAVMRHCWMPQHEPAGYTDLKERDKKQRAKPYPFYWQDIDIHGFCALGDDRAEGGLNFAAYESEIPYIEARDIYTKDGKTFGKSKGKFGWYGQDEALDRATNNQSEMCKVTVIDALDPAGEECCLEGCEHTGRKVYIHVSGLEDKVDEDNMWEEYDSPFPYCSFYIIGGRRTRDREPSARYRPMLLPMYVEAEALNYASTLLWAMIRGDYGPEGYYINYANADPRNIPEDPNHVYDFALPKEGKIQGFPGPVERMPRGLSPHLPTQIQLQNERMGQYMPNRFLTGNAFTEASNATGTAFLAQMQQASLPANGLLSQSDAVILKSRKAIVHAIKYWGMMDVPGAPTKWYAVMSGNNRNVVVKGPQAKHGEIFWVDAKKIDLDFDLQILTKSETLAEQQARWLLAWDQYSKGVITPEQLIRAAGVDDIEGQKELLRAAETYGLMRETAANLKKAAMVRIMSVFMDIDPQMAAGLLGQQQPGAEAMSGAGGGLGTPTAPGSILGQQAAAQGRSSRDLALAVNGAGGAGGVSGGGSPMQ